MLNKRKRGFNDEIFSGVCLFILAKRNASHLKGIFCVCVGIPPSLSSWRLCVKEIVVLRCSSSVGTGGGYIIVYSLFNLVYFRMRVITRVEFKAGKVWILFVARKKVYFSILYKHTNRKVTSTGYEKGVYCLYTRD